MKIAVLLPSLLNVGPNRVAFDIIDVLMAKDGIVVNVFYLDDKVGNKINFPCTCEKLSIKNIFQLYSFDLIHSHMFRPDALNSLLPFYKGKKISTIHNIVETDLMFSHNKIISNIFSKVWRYFWLKLDRCIVLTEVAKRYYIQFGLPNDKIEIITNGIQTSYNKPKKHNITFQIEKISNDFKIIGTACLFNKRKGLEQVIKALPVLTGYAFVILGDGPERKELIRLAKSLNVADRLFILGFVDNARSYFELFDVYVMPSRDEGLGLGMLEGVASKTPLVCSNIAVFMECFNEDEVAFFELDNIQSIVEAIKIAIRNNDKFTKNAFEKLKLKFTREVMAQNYISEYKRLT